MQENTKRNSNSALGWVTIRLIKYNNFLGYLPSTGIYMCIDLRTKNCRIRYRLSGCVSLSCYPEIHLRLAIINSDRIGVA